MTRSMMRCAYYLKVLAIGRSLKCDGCFLIEDVDWEQVGDKMPLDELLDLHSD